MQPTEPSAILLADLGYGDAGKGSLVDYLCRTLDAHTVVRYNGGAQAAHNVVTPAGRHHTFAQFGSGTFIPGVRTHLSRYMILHPLALLAEERRLQSLGICDAFSRLSIEREALVISPFQQAANRLKEMGRGAGRHGSCGMGIGETMSDWLAYGPDALFAGDLSDRPTIVKKLRRLRDAKLAQLEAAFPDFLTTPAAAEEFKIFDDPGIIPAAADVYQHLAGLVNIVDAGYLGELLDQPGVAVFEGAQGVLLDEWWGFYPYNSWSTLTFKNADTLLAENAFQGSVLKLGLLRGYATRHGAGPFVTEDPTLTASIQDLHNVDNPWQRSFRVGYLDLLALRYAIAVVGRVDGLAITNLDRMAEIPHWQLCTAYRYTGSAPDISDFFECQGNVITAIKVPPDPTDLLHQAELTRLLTEMLPLYADCENDPDRYLARIGGELDLPVLITSHGPSAREKTKKGGSDVYVAGSARNIHITPPT